LLSSGFERNYEKRFAVQQQFQEVAPALPKHARVVVHDENNHLGLEAQSIVDRFPFEYGISYGLQATPRDVYDLYRSLGATHVLWASKSKGTDSLAGDIMFFDFVRRRATDLGTFGSMHLSKLPDVAPTGPFNDTVAVFSCAGSYASGLYRVADLRVPVYGPQSSDFPAAAPRPLPRDWNRTLASVAEIAVAEIRCFHDGPKLAQLGFEEAAVRTHPGAQRGQPYSIWLKL
jgi:hypothetical protein